MQYAIITDQICDDLERALQIAKAHHYTHIELHNVFGKSIEECSLLEVESIRTLLQTYHLEVSCIASTVFFLCPLYKGDQVSLFNEAFHAIEGDLQTHLRYLENACRIAKRLNCPRVRIFPFRFPDNRKAPYGTQEDINTILLAVRKALRIAKSYDVTLVMENCPYSHLPKGMMTIQIIKAFQDPHLRLLWDPANSYRAIQEQVPKEYLVFSLMDELRYIYPQIDHIHIKDYHYDASLKKPYQHVALFDGDLPYDEIFTYLQNRGYTKTLSLEAEVPFRETLLSMDRFKIALDEKQTKNE